MVRRSASVQISPVQISVSAESLMVCTVRVAAVPCATAGSFHANRDLPIAPSPVYSGSAFAGTVMRRRTCRICTDEVPRYAEAAMWYDKAYEFITPVGHGYREKTPRHLLHLAGVSSDLRIQQGGGAHRRCMRRRVPFYTDTL